MLSDFYTDSIAVVSVLIIMLLFRHNERLFILVDLLYYYYYYYCKVLKFDVPIKTDLNPEYYPAPFLLLL
jgi:hypothetical protein